MTCVESVATQSFTSDKIEFTSRLQLSSSTAQSPFPKFLNNFNGLTSEQLVDITSANALMQMYISLLLQCSLSFAQQLVRGGRNALLSANRCSPTLSSMLAVFSITKKDN